MIRSPAKPIPSTRRVETQALVTVVPCGRGRGLSAISVIGPPGGPAGEYFLPFSLPNEDAPEREFTYAGLTTAIDRLRALRIDRVLIATDDDALASEVERREDPPKELSLAYIILGCKLNEFRRAKVVASHSSRLKQLRTKALSLASTIYSQPALAAAVNN